MTTTSQPSNRAPFKLAFVWLWVGIPMGWGVLQTVLKAKALFR